MIKYALLPPFARRLPLSGQACWTRWVAGREVGADERLGFATRGQAAADAGSADTAGGGAINRYAERQCRRVLPAADGAGGGRHLRSALTLGSLAPRPPTCRSSAFDLCGTIIE